jgi:hypothetical protein
MGNMLGASPLTCALIRALRASVIVVVVAVVLVVVVVVVVVVLASARFASLAPARILAGALLLCTDAGSVWGSGERGP